MRILCVIPARGGSKGVPRKNLRRLGGLPLVVYSIKQACEAGIPREHIVVSSDDEEILNLARLWHVTDHKRPDSISGDLASTESAMIDALSVYPDCDYVLLLQPTSPIRMRGRINQALELMQTGNYTSLVTTTKFYNFCWYQQGTEGQIIWNSTYDCQNRPMRQDLPLESFLHFDNGNIYVTQRSYLEESQCRLGGKVCVLPISNAEGMQIDDEEDFRVIEKVLGVNYLGVKYAKV